MDRFRGILSRKMSNVQSHAWDFRICIRTPACPVRTLWILILQRSCSVLVYEEKGDLYGEGSGALVDGHVQLT